MNNNNSQNTEARLSGDKVGSLVARYSIPGAIAFLFFSIQSIVDGIIVGNFLGPDALASVSLILPAYTIPSSFALILAIGAQAQMSIAMGDQDYLKSKTVLKTGGFSILAYALLVTLLFNAFPEMLAELMGAKGDLFAGSLDYIHGVMPFMAANYFFVFLDSLLKTLGHPRFSMMMVVGFIVLNIVLSILFVTVFDLGTFGVGLATGVSITTGCVLSGCVVSKALRGNRNLRGEMGKFSWRLLGRIFYNGSSEGLTEIAMSVTIVLFNFTFLKYAGKEGVAAFAVTNYVIFVGACILLGVSNGTIPIISYNYGAGLWHRVRQTLKVVLRTNFIIGLVFLVILLGFGEYLIAVFLDDSSQSVIDQAVHGSRIMGFAFLLNGFNIFSASFFTALDKAKWSLVISSCRGLIFIVIGLLVLPSLFSINGVWMTVVVAELCTAAISLYLIRKTLRGK